MRAHHHQMALITSDCRQVLSSYAALLIDLATHVPDGLICFFVSCASPRPGTQLLLLLALLALLALLLLICCC